MIYDNMFSTEITKQNVSVFVSASHNAHTITIPGVAKGPDGSYYVPIGIEAEAFLDYPNLVKLTIPPSIEYISVNAFATTNVIIHIDPLMITELSEPLTYKFIKPLDSYLPGMHSISIKNMFNNIPHLHRIVVPGTPDEVIDEFEKMNYEYSSKLDQLINRIEKISK